MRFETSKNNLPLSIIIRWGTDSKGSHFLSVFDNKFVIHSNFMGVNLAWYNYFLKHNEIVRSVQIDCSLELEEKTYQSLLNSDAGDGYDFPALAYWFWRGLLNILFKIPVPNRNAWSSNHLLLCLAIYGKMPHELTGQKIDDDVLEMMTPDKLIDMIIKRVESGELKGHVIK